MITYSCENINCSMHNLESDTSDCKVCGNRNNIKSQIYWCHECNVPIYKAVCSCCGNVGNEISADIRPVFPEERLLIEVLLDKPFSYLESSVWCATGSVYIINGKKVRLSQNELMKKSPKEVKETIDSLSIKNSYEYFNKWKDKFVQANKERFNDIDTEAIEFIQNEKESYNLGECFVSFSGGKDSTVVSDLVIRGLSEPRVIHFYGDTTLEFPSTLDYIKRFKEEHSKTPMLVAKNKEKNFYDMCDVIGPPSRVMRWCCIVFKTGAITAKLNKAFKHKTKVLTFYGIRRSESTSRGKYDRISDSPKITKQRVASPIINWFDFDIWLYILSRNIDFNDAYKLGYSRVGCWCCPNNTKWAQYLSAIYMPELSDRWRNQLIEFAKKIGKPDAENYVDEGGWKARQGGNGLEISKNTFIEFKPCATSNQSYNYELNKDINEDLYELFKPFGWINKEMGNERLGQIYIVDRKNNPQLILEGRIGQKNLKVTIINSKLARAKSLKEAKQKVDCQITKYQMCLGCIACESICKHDAITVKVKAHINEYKTSPLGDSYRIDNEKCIRCGECINHFDGGCYMRKVVITKRGE